MEDLTIDLQDLRILFLKSEYTNFSKQGFESFVIECKKSYLEYGYFFSNLLSKKV
jgi:hypothetical protein